MRVIVLTHRLPYPPDKGERIRSFHWLRALASAHHVDLLTLSDQTVPAQYLDTLEDMVDNVYVIPRRRWLAPWRLAWSLVRGRSFTEGVFHSRRFRNVFAQLVRDGNYDACLAVCSGVGAYLPDESVFKRLIVDLVDVDSEKWRLFAQSHHGLLRWIYLREAVKIAELEADLTRRADVTVLVSEDECQLLEATVPGSRPEAIPNGVDTTLFAPHDDQPALDSLVFVGQMDYFPNVDAVTWFAETVWPEIHARWPELAWRIVGRKPTKAVRALGRLANVTVTGEVEDTRPYMKSAISIAPLRVACGLQNKVLEALACGCPVVVSPSAARGLALHEQHELLLADEPAEWVFAVKLLLADKTLASHLQTSGRRAVVERYNWQAVDEKMRSCVETRQMPHIPTQSAATAKEPALKT